MNQRGKMSIFYYTTISAKLSHSIGASLTAGFNYYRLDGSDVANPFSTKNSGTLDGPNSTLRAVSSNRGYFTQVQTNFAESAFLTAGLRAERNPDFGRDVGTVVSPRIGAAYVRSAGPLTLKFRASYGESVRAPDPNQNQSFSTPGVDQLYNPALKPERQRGGDGGMDLYWGSRASFSATYYRQTVFDLIDLSKLVGDPPHKQRQQQNIGSIGNRGWELEAQYGFGPWQVSGAFSITQSRIQRLDPLYGGDYRPGDHLFDVPLHSTGLTVAYRPSSATSLYGGLTSVSSWVEQDVIALLGLVFGGAPPRPLQRDYWTTYPGLTKFRLGVEQKLGKGITGTLNIENVTNSRAFESTNIEIPSPRIFTWTLRAPY